MTIPANAFKNMWKTLSSIFRLNFVRPIVDLKINNDITSDPFKAFEFFTIFSHRFPKLSHIRLRPHR